MNTDRDYDEEPESVPARSIPGFPGIDWQADPYDPDDGEIVCEAHGLAGCWQAPCGGLRWPTFEEMCEALE